MPCRFRLHSPFHAKGVNLVDTWKLQSTAIGLSIVLLHVLFQASMASLQLEAGASKILVYPFGHCLNSHLLNAERLVDILSQAGHHQVDMLVSHSYATFDHRRHSDIRSKPLQPLGNTRLIVFKGPESYVPVCDYDSLDFMLYASLKQRFSAFFETSVRYCDALLSDNQLTSRLKSTNYDLVIVESIDPCSRVLVDYLDVPFILLVTTGLGHFDTNPRPPSYLPAAIAPFTTHMTFGQRILNTIMKLMYDRAIPAFMGVLTPFEELKKKHNINTSIGLADTFDRSSIKLVNSDFAVDYPAPIEPDTVLVGGFAVGSPSALPDDIREFMDGAGENGVIIMSFGTIVSRFNPSWTKIFADVFARLPARVLWRYKGSTGDNDNYTFSSNIKLVGWLPQVSVLAHPKTRLFVSHCGLNGLFEAVRYSVPVLAIPLSGDQLNNAAKLSDHLKMGVTVDIHTMTVESLYRDAMHVLTDRQFASNAREVSQRLADQPMSAAARIRFWVDYVIRHKGAPHLRSDANRLPWYQYLCLDVFVCLSGVSLFILFVLFRLVLKFFRILLKLCLYLKRRLQNDAVALKKKL